MLHSQNILQTETDPNSITTTQQGRNFKKSKMQSAKLQYIMPDESIKGKINEGVIAQYPFFAPDRGYMKKAPKMTKADELYLRKFMLARAHKDIARIDKTNLADRQYVSREPEESEDDGDEDGKQTEKVDTSINDRLFLERNKGKIGPGQLIDRSASGDKVTLTSAIFGENRYFQQKEDTTEDKAMHNYVKGDWKSSAFANKEKPSKSALTEKKGKTGNVMPFFPSQWKKNANDMFNIIMNGPEAVEDNYEETTHAAVYKKNKDQETDQSLSPFLQQQKEKTPPSMTVRPTSGKHYAREQRFKKRKGELEMPNPDPLNSNVAKNYEKSKQIEGLLNRLADYMAGEIPDNGDLDDLFKKNGGGNRDPNNPLDEPQIDDDQTTNYTKVDEPPRHKSIPQLSKEPIFGPPEFSKPHNEIDADSNQIDFLDVDIPMANLDKIPEVMHIESDDGDTYLPDIYATTPAKKQAMKRQASPPKNRDTENLLIYKDFDTSLTKVKSAVRKLPRLDQTTSKRGEDLIRDRLLSFNVKNGQIAQPQDRRAASQLQTINERSKALFSQRKIGEQITQLKMKTRAAKDMQHKAFWVHNSSKQLPSLDSARTIENGGNGGYSGPVTARVNVSHSTPQLKGIAAHLKNKQENLRMSLDVQKRVKNGFNPIPIQDNEKLTSPDKKTPEEQAAADMKLVQQYVLIRGRLQPALKYIAQNPMFNRYQVKNAGAKQGYQEIVTYPTVSGNLKMKNKHVGVNFDDRDIPAKSLPNEQIEDQEGEKNLEGLVKTLQNKNIKYNRAYYSKVIRQDIRAVDSDEIEDPRSLRDIEQENVDLKEQFIHQMLTLEQYLAVASMWHAEQEDGYNPFEEGLNIADGDQLQQRTTRVKSPEEPEIVNSTNAFQPQRVRQSGEYDLNKGLGLGQQAEDGWIDYVDNVNTISNEMEQQQHDVVFDLEGYKKLQSGEAYIDENGNQVLAASGNPYQHQNGSYSTKKLLKDQQSSLALPSQVHSLNTKIRNIFFRQSATGSQMNTPDFDANNEYSPSPSRALVRGTGAQTTRKWKSSSNEFNHDYTRKLQFENNQIRQMLEADFKNQRIIDLENKIRNNKRIIVNSMSENIFQLRFGFDGNQKAAQKLDRDELLMRMLQSRLKRIRIVNNLIKISSERRYKLLVWGVHSDLIDARRLVRVMGDIVILVQEKNLIFEMHGRKNFIKVGEIELKLDWPILIRSKFGPMDAKDYYSRKLRTEIDDNNALLRQIEKDMQTSTQMSKEMKAFISAIFGNDGWMKLVEARWLRNKQRKQNAEYDPKDVVPQYVKGYATSSLVDKIVPRTIREELPTHGTDQFGDYHTRSGYGTDRVQQASGLLINNLHLFNKFKPIKGIAQKQQQQRVIAKNPTIASRALKGQSSAQLILQQRQQPAENEQADPYGLVVVEEVAQADLKSKDGGDSMFMSNAGAMIDRSFQDDDSVVNHRTVQDNVSENNSLGGRADHNKPLTLNAPSEAGDNDFAMKLGVPMSEFEEGSYHGDKQLTKVLRDEEDAKKALDRIRAQRELKDQQELVIQKPVDKKKAPRKSKRFSKNAQAAVEEEKKRAEEGPKKSNWLEKIRQEQLLRDGRATVEKEERDKRLRAILDSDSEENEDNFDYKNMVGNNLTDFLTKIENHVKAEQVILDAWNNKDEQGRDDLPQAKQSSNQQ